MASVGQPPSHNLHSGQEQDCKISSSNHLNSPGGQNLVHSETFSDDSNNSVSAGDANVMCDNNTAATGGTIDNGVAGSDSNNGYPDNGFSSSNLDDQQEHHLQHRQPSRNPSGGNNNSESSISSSTNPSSVGGAGESDVEASGESVAGANYRGSCVTEDDAGSSSHSEVRSSSPGLADADADVEDSPSGSEETGSESERGGGSSAGGSHIAAGINSASNSIMYAPNTVGFPPTRSSWSQSIPAGGSFGTGTKFSTGSNPFAVKGIPGGSVSSSSVPPISSPRIVLNNSTNSGGNGSACGSSGNLIGSGGGLNSSSSSSFASNVAAGASSSSSSAAASSVTSGRWGSCSPQPLRPSSWNARSIIRPSALGSSLGGSGVSSSTAAPVTASPLAPSVLASHSSTNFFSQLGGAGAADSAGQTLENNSTSSSSFVLRPPKLSTPFSLVGTAAGRSEASSTQSSSILSHGSPPEPSSSSVASSAVPATSITKPSELMFVPLKKDEGSGSVIVLNTPESVSTTDSNVTTAGLSTSSTAGTFGANVTASSSSSASFSSVVAQDAERSFVFGSNLRERAAGGATGESTSNGISSSTSEGGGLFSAALKNVQPMPSTSSSTGQEVAIEAGSSTFGDESHCDRKRRFDDTPVITGEEDEFNVLQITCRLFAYDSTNCSWIERGRGLLRLNDRTESNNDLQSRVIVRTKGSLRLMLNTNVWGGMKVDRASPKSVRFTANDNGQIRLFLVMATVGEAEQLFQALDWRVKNQKTVEDKGTGSGEASSSTDPAAAVEASSDDVSQSIQVSSRRRTSLIGNETGKLTSSDDDDDVESDDDDDDDDEDKELCNLPPKKKRFSDVDSATVGNVNVVGGEGSNGGSSYNNTNFSGRPTPPIIRINNHEMIDDEDEELN